MKTQSVLPSIMVAMLPAMLSAQTIFFDDFNSYSVGQASLDATYESRYTNTSASIQITDTSGLGGSHAWSNSADNQIVRKDIGIDFTNGAVLEASASFQYNGSGGIAGPQLGFTLTPTGNVTGAGDLSGRLNNNALQLRQNNGTVSTGATLSLTTGEWYQIVYTLQKTETLDTFAATLSVYNSSSAGVVGSVVGTYSDTITDATFYADSDIYFVLRENTSIANMDNFAVTQSAIPEPSTAALLIGATVLGALVYRRRKAQ
ncbi:MAG: PEP-CTERM sorting domain-containing protein [Puniceicoccales bacterium]